MAFALLPTRSARACGAICDVPEYWDLQFSQAGDLSIVTNFGLILQQEGDWLLGCEAAVGGGLITSAVRTPRGHVVSTTEGLYRENSDCDYSRVLLGVADDWPLAFASTTIDDRQHDFVLALDAQTDEISVARSIDEASYETLRTLPREQGYRQLSVAGPAPWLFVSGQTFSPRVWHVAFSDGGERWTQASFELDTELTLLPLGVDPESPELMLQVQTPSDEPGQLWSFDAVSAELTPHFVLPGSEAVVGFAALGSSWALASDDDERGKLYVASRGDADFELADSELPRLSCLRAFADELYVCGAEFTREAPFALARSADLGQSWQPLMAVADLGRIDACPGACDDTVNWLHATYGSLAVGGLSPSPSDAGSGQLSSGGVPSRPGIVATDLDAGAVEGSTSDASSEGRERSARAGGTSSSGCAVHLAGEGAGTVAWLFGLALAAAWRRRITARCTRSAGLVVRRR